MTCAGCADDPQHNNPEGQPTMNPKDLLRALLWLAALGLVLIFGTRIVSKVGAKAADTLPG